MTTSGRVVGGPRRRQQSSQGPVEEQTRQTSDKECRQTGPATSAVGPAARARARTAVDVEVLPVGPAYVVVVGGGGAVVDGGAEAADAAHDVDGARRRAVAAARATPDARQLPAATRAPLAATPAAAATHDRVPVRCVSVDGRRRAASLHVGTRRRLALDRRRRRTVNVHVSNCTPVAAHAADPSVTGSR